MRHEGFPKKRLASRAASKDVAAESARLRDQVEEDVTSGVEVGSCNEETADSINDERLVLREAVCDDAMRCTYNHPRALVAAKPASKMD